MSDFPQSKNDRVSTALFASCDSFDASDNNTNQSFSNTSDSMMALDDDDIPSPPRSTRKSPAGAFALPTSSRLPPNTPKTRLFFDDEKPATTGKTPVPPRRKYRPTSLSSMDSDTTMGYSPSPQGSRKRTSTDSNRDAPMEESSPKISPNSFLTIDGRFVQSKNPFSSPMVSEASTNFVSAGLDAPALPMMMQSGSCSPVPEDGTVSTEASSSYHKVRRLHRGDQDIVAASLHKFQPRISPTEVSGFPFPPTTQHRPTPPTPVKKRQNHHPTLHGLQVKPANTQSRFEADFDVIGELGKGTFGRVLKVLSRLDGCMYAIKTTLRPAKGAADRDRMLKEVRDIVYSEFVSS